MTQFSNRRPTNRPALPTPALLQDPPISDLKDWWLNVKRFQTQQFFSLENTDQVLGVQITNEVIARRDGDEVLATEIDSLVVVIGTKSKISVQGFAPASPAVNDLWLDTADQNKYKFWDGAVWQYKQDLVLAASVTTEASVRAGADGFLSGKYTLTVAAGNVVTGMNITSSTGGGTNISDVTFVATNFKIYNSVTGVTMFNVAGTDVSLANTLVVSTSGKVYIGAGNYNAGDTAWYVDSAGKFSLKDKLSWDGTTLAITGVVTATSGVIGGFAIGASTLIAGTDNNYFLLNTTAGAPGITFGDYSSGGTVQCIINKNFLSFTHTNSSGHGVYLGEEDVFLPDCGGLFLYNFGTQNITLKGSDGTGVFAGKVSASAFNANGTDGATGTYTLIAISQMTFEGGLLVGVL